MIMVNSICAIVMLLAMLFVIAAGIQKMWRVEHGFARIILSGLLNDIRNSVGALVFSAWKGIHYVREKAAVVSNPNSTDQANIRARIANASKRWTNTLTVAQRGAWENFAQQLGSASTSEQAQEGGTKVVIPDNRGIMSGFNAYVMVNCWAYTGGVMTLAVWQDDAPIGIDAPNAPTALTCTCIGDGLDVVNNKIVIDWVDPLSPPTTVDARIRIWLVSNDAGVHRQLVDTVAIAAETYDIVNVKVALGIEVLISSQPGNYHIQVDCISAEGQKSPPSNVCQLELPSTPCSTGP